MPTHTMNDTEMKLESSDILEQRTAALKDLFPEVFTEGKVDFEKLRLALGQQAEVGRERYGLTWAGKADAMRAVQIPSTATLVPVQDESVDWDTTQNVFIEGENLEVLKLLQKSYCGKVKMIYIDPPYNTGNDLIYLDNYRDSIGDYLRLTGQISGQGQKLTSNAETGGRYHSNWLNMMYPRLFLARNLLRDDGVIFVSIDDHEVQNLRCVMDEIFGDENYVGTLVWQAKKGGGSDKRGIVEDHEYVLCYSRTEAAMALNRLSVHSQPLDRTDERGPYRRGRELNKWGASSRREDRPSMFFPIPGPNGEDVYPIRNDGDEGRWRLGKPQMLALVQRGDADFVTRDGGGFTVYEKIRSDDPREKPYRTWLTDAGTTADGSKLVRDLFGAKVFEFAKPLKLIQHLISIGTKEEADIVLDFFAGSGTTAHAAMALTEQDGIGRHTISVQHPEPTKPGSEAADMGLRNLAELGARRVKLAAEAIKTGNRTLVQSEGMDLDFGFRFYSLQASSFKIWNADYQLASESAIAEQLRLHTDHVLPDRSQEDIASEILLKAGYLLTSRISQIEVAGQQAFSTSDGNLIICLATPIQAETLREIMGLQPRPVQVICLDHAFEGNDQVKTNLKLEMKAHEIEFRTV